MIGFNTGAGPGTDLRPEDVRVNADRGNLDFDSWQPRDAVKGDVARMLFYMAVRYEGTDGFANLELNDSVNNGAAPYVGRLSVLKQWSRQDPPDQSEKNRNQLIYDRFQHNRNPFIDHPEWVAAIWS